MSKKEKTENQKQDELFEKFERIELTPYYQISPLETRNVSGVCTFIDAFL